MPKYTKSSHKNFGQAHISEWTRSDSLWFRFCFVAAVAAMAVVYTYLIVNVS